MMPSCSAGVDVGLGGLVRLVGRFVRRRRGGDRAASPATDARDPARHRAERAGDRARRSAAAAPGRARDRGRRSASGSSSSQTSDERRDARATTDRQRAAPSMPMPRASSAVARAGDQAEQQPDRDEQQQRVVEIGAERAGPVAPLGDEAQRQPHQRAERGLDRAEVHGGAREQEDARAESSSRPLARSGLRAGRPCGAAAARRARIRPSSRSWS